MKSNQNKINIKEYSQKKNQKKNSFKEGLRHNFD